MINPAEHQHLSWLEIDLGRIRHNYRMLKGLLPAGVAAFGVVKADAYGHGAIPASEALLKEGVEMLCVARVEEARELRDAGIHHDLMILAPPLPPQAEQAVALDCRVIVCDPIHIEAAASAARKSGRRARVHLKVDTGMGRLGVKPEDAVEFAKRINAEPSLELEGIMTHFPCADAVPDQMTGQQIQTFVDIIQAVSSHGMDCRYAHAANTAATMMHPDSHLNAVRTGIGLYGQFPDVAMPRELDLRPAMAMRARIVFLKEVPAGTGISYGHTWHAPRASRIATIPLGYADGFPRHATNQTTMLLRGQRAPQVGRVCMDHILLDVTDVPEVQLGDVVTAFGEDDLGNVLRPEDVAARYGSIGYELTTRVGKRLPRVVKG